MSNAEYIDKAELENFLSRLSYVPADARAATASPS